MADIPIYDLFKHRFIMISVCIPVYNYSVAILVNELSNQMKVLDVPCEIIVIDDASQKFKEVNKMECEQHSFIELSENIGRSKIRNLFLKYAKYEYLLFLDCDSLIKSASFLSNYASVIKDNPNVVCGGRIYDTNRPNRERILNWKFGVLRESQACAIRRKKPNNSFLTNNFLIYRKIFEEIKFDERIANYGHEDTLFGYCLEKKNIEVTHIDNPVVNGDVEKNRAYLHKACTGVINLVDILEYTNYDKKLIDSITILKFYFKLKKIETFVYLSFITTKPLIYFLLTRGYLNIYLFDFYKLGILIENMRKSSRNREQTSTKTN